ncbi:MAG: hypothetical protein ACTHJX_11265 [Terriglobales bacterium]
MSRRFCQAAVAALTLFTPLGASAAQLGLAAQSVMPQGTRQVISINYHRLATDPTAMQLEARVLPPAMQGFEALLTRGGINASQDVNRLSFATFENKSGIGLIGVVEGNLGAFKLDNFFKKTAKQPAPPQIDGVNVYNSNGLTFYVPDSSTLVFGSLASIQAAIATQQGGATLAQNEQMSNLIAGTQSSDIWSVLDAAGSQAMVQGMIGAKTGTLDASLIQKHFDGARYTIAFANEIQVNLELMTSDSLSAAAVSTALNATLALRQRQETNPAAKALLGAVQVDSAGSHAFLQLLTPASSLASLMSSDLMQSILH